MISELDDDRIDRMRKYIERGSGLGDDPARELLAAYDAAVKEIEALTSRVEVLEDRLRSVAERILRK